MKSYTFRISSPVHTVSIDNVVKAIVRTTAGDIGILAGHVPYSSVVKQGTVKLTLEDNTVKEYSVSDGIIKVADNIVTVLTQTIN